MRYVCTVSSQETTQHYIEYSCCCCCSVAQSCPTLCNPIDCNVPGFPVPQQLPEPTQTHVHCIGDAIQPFHPLSSSSPPPSIKVFSSESALRMRWPKDWNFSFSISPSNEYSGLISIRIDWFDFLAVQRTQESSPTPEFKSISSLALRFLYGPTLICT